MGFPRVYSRIGRLGENGMVSGDVDTIVAISTPVGRGGIGVVRLSGPQSRAVVAPLLRLRHELAAGAARFGEILDLSDRTPNPSDSNSNLEPRTSNPPPVLDECVVTYF